MASLRALEVLLMDQDRAQQEALESTPVSDEELQRGCRDCTASAAGPEWSLEMIEAVVVDLVSVLFQSDELWTNAREAFVQKQGGRWHEGADRTGWAWVPSNDPDICTTTSA